MPGWSLVRGLGVGLPLENIDTDQLIPARFMSTPRAQGYGGFLLHDLRRNADGQPDPEFPLNRTEAGDARILVTRRNFGAGSSREAAVYALVDAGFRIVVAPSFGDIFSANAVNNGLLPARLPGEAVEALLASTPCEMAVDLEAMSIVAPCGEFHFDLDPVWRQKLINGWDDIDLTLSEGERIVAYAAARRDNSPWVWPG